MHNIGDDDKCLGPECKSQLFPNY